MRPHRYGVFVSYRHEGEDGRFARDLVAALERAIRQSRFTVAVISARYLESGHTEEEAIITKVLDMGDRKRRLSA